MPALTLVLLVFATAAGACVGSFVNVLIYRLPRERSIASPGSHCFCCGTPLVARDLVPVFSFLVADRRCRYCGVALSGQYAWVEAICAVLYALIYLRWGETLTTLVYFVAAAAMLAATGTDLRFKLIPNALNQTILVAGLLGAAVGGWLPSELRPQLPTFGLAVLGSVVGWLWFEAIVRLGRWALGQEAMGGGDVLLAGAVGALLGPSWLFAVFFFISVLSGAVLGGGLMLVGLVKRREPIPFGPFMVLGALVVMLWPQVAEALARLEGFR